MTRRRYLLLLIAPVLADVDLVEEFSTRDAAEARARAWQRNGSEHCAELWEWVSGAWNWVETYQLGAVLSRKRRLPEADA